MEQAPQPEARAPADKLRYDRIGHRYTTYRREDPRILDAIRASLGNARTVVNVGAGAGSYEPADLEVIAVEPSDVMISQRPPRRGPAVRAVAAALPLKATCVDAAMSVLSLHHWVPGQKAGVRELRRVARDRVVILTYDARVAGRMWLVAEYLPEIAALDLAIFPAPETVAGWLGANARIEPLLLTRDTPDWMLGSYWAHPERVLDVEARSATSGFARMPAHVVERAVATLERDLADGTWDARHAALREMDAYDAGLRLIVAEPA